MLKIIISFRLFRCFKYFLYGLCAHVDCMPYLHITDICGSFFSLWFKSEGKRISFQMLCEQSNVLTWPTNTKVTWTRKLVDWTSYVILRLEPPILLQYCLFEIKKRFARLTKISNFKRIKYKNWWIRVFNNFILSFRVNFSKPIFFKAFWNSILY